MRTGLYDLLAPQFLVGLNLPTWLDGFLNFLRLDTLEETWDDTAIVYYGKAQFVGDGTAQAPTSATTPAGGKFQWEDVNLQFRLTIPRKRSDFIQTAISQAATAAPANSPISDVNSMLNRFELSSVTTDPSDYPGVAFQLEILFSAISIHLPKGRYLPAKVASDGWLVHDTDEKEVKITLPKIALTVTQGDTIGDLDFSFDGWGVYGLDDPADPKAGELIKMEPPLCIHESRTIGFGLEKIVLDLTDTFTPPEILEQFGTGDEFEGLWIPHVRFFIASGRNTGLAFDVRANDLLYDFNQGISGEFGFDIIHRNKALFVDPILYQGDVRRTIVDGNKKIVGQTTTITNSRATIAADGELQLAIRGGYPPHTITIKLDANTLASQPYKGDATRLVWPFNNPGTGKHTLSIKVVDSSNPPYTYNETIKLELTPAGVSIGTLTTYKAPSITVNSPVTGYEISLQPIQNDVNKIFLNAHPVPVNSMTVDGSPVSPAVDSNGNFSIDVTPDGSPYRVIGNWTPAPTNPLETVHFAHAVPSTSQIASETTRLENTYGAVLLSFIQRAVAANQNLNLSIEGNASYDGVWQEDYNQGLSDRRVEALKGALQNIVASFNAQLPVAIPTISINITSEVGNATERARGALSSAPNNGTLSNCGSYPHNGTATGDYSPACYRNAMISFTAAGNATVDVTVSRAAPTQEDIRTPLERGPQPTEPKRPPIFKSIGARVRLERDLLVLAELHGQLDFRTAAEENAGLIQTSEQANNSGTTNTNHTGNANTISTNIESQNGASADSNVTPQEGIVDYKLQMSYDSATKRITYTLGLGFDKNQKDGFVHLKKFTPAALSNTFGSLLTFAPLIADSIDSAVTAEGDDTIAPIILAAAEIGIGIALGVTGVFKMERITLFGAELNMTQALVDHYDFDDAKATQLSALFDYAIDFTIDLDLGVLKIKSSTGKPLRVRYNALGFRLDFNNGKYIPVFDTSKGYEFAMADPGLLQVSSPFGNILKVVGARVSRVNPLTAEFDLGINANLGIISIDQIKVKVPIDPPGFPTIIPTKATVNIPGTFIGSGYIDLSNGIRGSIDITIVPVKLRLMADIGINPLESNGRKVTAFYLGLGIEFPAPIPLAGSGLGLYGVLGLFGMHYKRDENQSADVPALDWLNNKVNGDPTKIEGWIPNLDKWAFGVGAVLGTIDSGFTLNLKGMLLLELPGPRILVLVNMKLLSIKPDTKGKATLGVLAVVDLDFNLDKLTIGVLIGYEIKDLLKLQIPVQAGFDFNNAKKWHLYIGKISAPVSAEVLGIVKAQGYFMIDGDKIENFPGPSGPMTLQGLAIAMGLKAAVIFGDEGSGLYLKVSAGFDAGLTFSPLHVYGVMELRGTLRLFIISISAWADLAVEAPNPTYLKGKACGKIDFFFFSIKGCVTISIGDKPPIAKAEQLLTGMVLQSRSSALLQGQGSDRSIDGSLGNAKEVNAVSNKADNKLLKVPVDSFPILKFKAPSLGESSISTFTEPIKKAPKITTSGWINQGENRQIRYTLTSIEINPPVQLNGLPKPPVSWVSNSENANGNDTTVDLALFSWSPDATPRAIQRSAELTKRITERWGNLCNKVAPEACILWTFNYEQLGYSDTGWHLEGIMWPDPPETERAEMPKRDIHVYEDYGELNDPLFEHLLTIAHGLNIEHAKVIGDVFAGLTGGKKTKNEDTTHLSPDKKRYFGKVLELPYLFREMEVLNDFNLPVNYLQMVQEQPQKIYIDCSGEITKARLLIAIQDGTDLRRITINSYDEEDQVIDTFTAFDVLEIQGLHGGNAPSKWVDSTGPWYKDLVGVLSYLGRMQNHLERHVLAWDSKEQTVKLEIIVDVKGRKINSPPSLLLCAIELCKLEEKKRVTHEKEVKETMVETVEGAFAGGQLRPLLEKDTRYTISVNYKTEAKEKDADGNWQNNDSTETQRFTFMTDDKSPAKLEPWVLLTTPYDNNPYHFTEDPIEIYFNDSSVIQLFDKYNESLKAVLRKANGDHANTEPPIDLSSLIEVSPAIMTPFEETLRAVMDDKECVNEIESEKHQKFVLNIPLDRGTEYTLDVEVKGAQKPTAPSNPLFRISFKTSRYSGVDELAAIMKKGYVNHRRLESSLAILSDNPSDQEVDTVLLNAGLEAIEHAKHPSYSYLWAPNGNSHHLVAILIDAPEPLWRFRNLPAKETVSSESGDMEHWVMKSSTYLRVAETTSSTVVNKIVHTPGGTRAIIYLINPGGKNIELSLIQTDIVLDGSAGTDITHVMLNTEMPAKAPWELNEITD